MSNVNKYEVEDLYDLEIQNLKSEKECMRIKIDELKKTIDGRVTRYENLMKKRIERYKKQEEMIEKIYKRLEKLIETVNKHMLLYNESREKNSFTLALGTLKKITKKIIKIEYKIDQITSFNHKKFERVTIKQCTFGWQDLELRINNLKKSDSYAKSSRKPFVPIPYDEQCLDSFSFRSILEDCKKKE